MGSKSEPEPSTVPKNPGPFAEVCRETESGHTQVRRPWFDFQHPLPWSVRLLLGGIVWCLFLGFWQWSATSGIAPARLFPAPTRVIGALYTLIVDQGFAYDILASVKRIVLSFVLAVGVALPMGLLMGSFSVLHGFLNPLVAAFRYLPAPAFIPLLLMWLGTGDEQKIALLFLGVVWFLVTLIADNTALVRADFIDTARTLGADRRGILWQVVFRAALPSYVDTCRQMLAVSWTYLVIAEIVAATDGIGAMMMRAKRFVHVDEIMAGILVIGLLGLLFDGLFRLLHRFAFPYLYISRS